MWCNPGSSGWQPILPGSRYLLTVSIAPPDMLACPDLEHQVSQIDKDYSLEFHVWYAGIIGFVRNVRTILQHRWRTGVEWLTDIAQTDLLSLYGLRDLLKQTLWARGLDWTQLPTKCHPPLVPLPIASLLCIEHCTIQIATTTGCCDRIGTRPPRIGTRG